MDCYSTHCPPPNNIPSGIHVLSRRKSWLNGHHMDSMSDFKNHHHIVGQLVSIRLGWLVGWLAGWHLYVWLVGWLVVNFTHSHYNNPSGTHVPKWLSKFRSHCLQIVITESQASRQNTGKHSCLCLTIHTYESTYAKTVYFRKTMTCNLHSLRYKYHSMEHLLLIKFAPGYIVFTLKSNELKKQWRCAMLSTALLHAGKHRNRFLFPQVVFKLTCGPCAGQKGWPLIGYQ